jgi:hypothetical protein
MPESIAARALLQDAAVVYSVEGGRLRNVTRHYRYLASEVWKPVLPKQVDAGSRFTADLLGEGWHQLEGSHRWMGQRALFRIAGPTSSTEKLYLKGYCPEEQFAKGHIYLSIFIDGEPAGRVELRHDQGSFEAEMRIASRFTGAPELNIRLEASRTFRVAGDGRELGLAFGTFTIR